MRTISFNVIWKRIKAIKFMLKDKNVALWKKALVVFGIIYLIMPFDLIPIMIFPVNFLDDIILWVWILVMLRDTLDNYWLGEKTVDLSKSYAGKTVYDDVEYVVDAVNENGDPNIKETNENE